MSKTTRRGLLAGVGLAGLGLFGSSGASANLGGGPEAGAMTDYQVPYFRVPESALDTPGVVGRRVEITSGGATYDTGDQLVDLGDRWELVSPNYGSLSTGEQEITNETLVFAYLSGNQTISSGSYKTVALDTTKKDERGEFDTSANQLSPDNTGWYHISAAVSFFNSTGGDHLNARVREPSKSMNILSNRLVAGGVDTNTIQISSLVKLRSGNNYEFQVANDDSSVELAGGDSFKTRLSCRSVFR